MQNPTAQSLLGGTQALNNSSFATLEAAQQFAASLGGVVVRDPNSVSDWNQTAWAIKLPDGTTVNAGAIANILGNAAYGNTNVQSGEIAKLFGASYQPGLAEALLSGQRVTLTAGPVAPGYVTTPLSASYKPPTTSGAAAATTTSGGAIVTSSNSASAGAPGGSSAPAVNSTSFLPAGFSLSDVPMWGWALALGAVFFFSRSNR
jgi:hypothetical protein